ncbi:MAG: hypothetical protein H5U03_00625 [Clostridia bacterium]|nr:hypothetical protein [Clostridia bacterium]
MLLKRSDRGRRWQPARGGEGGGEKGAVVGRRQWEHRAGRLVSLSRLGWERGSGGAGAG